MKKHLNNIKNNWIMYLILLQPILDIIAYFGLKKEDGMTISFLIRALILFIITLYVFVTTKEKKKYILCMCPFILMSFFHVINCYRVGYINLISDISYLVKVIQMPVFAINFIFYFRKNKEKIDNFREVFIFNLLIIVLSMIISLIVGDYNHTYGESGVIGWFSSANTQTMILISLMPLFLYYSNFKINKLSKYRNIIFVLTIFISFLVFYFNGTKGAYISMIFDYILLLFLIIIDNKEKTNKIFRILVTLIAIGSTIILFPYSITKNRQNQLDKNNIDMEEVKNNTTAEDIKKMDISDSLKTKILSDERLIKISSYYYYREMFEIFGVDRVISVIGYDNPTSFYTNNRIRKIVFAKIVDKESDTFTKLFGFEYTKVGQYSMDMENDITALFYYYGYFGITVYLGFILILIALAIINIFNYPIKIFNKEFITILYTIFLLVFASEYTGALLRKPNANIYLALLLALLYAKIYLYDKPKINNKKISFLLLHLGFGGIEKATINTANSLCDNYEIELIVFYKLKHEAVFNINSKISIKYLYEGDPNREEFLAAFHKYKLFKVIKEGIKSVDILLKKKLFIIREINESTSRYIVSTRMEFSILLSKYGPESVIKIAQEHQYHNNDKNYINTMKTKYKNIDILMALTSTLKNDYERILENNKKIKIVLMPNMLYSLPNMYTNIDNKNLISIGRLSKEKRVNEIIDIFSQIEDKTYSLIIVGDGSEKKILEKKVKDLKLTNVEFTGYKNEKQINKYLIESSIFLMASETEGLPMVLLEAMSYGIPCIAYQLENGIDDIIKNNENGYVIKKRNENEYITKINELIKNTELRKKMSNNAIETSKKFSKIAITKKWLEILK